MRRDIVLKITLVVTIVLYIAFILVDLPTIHNRRIAGLTRKQIAVRESNLPTYEQVIIRIVSWMKSLSMLSATLFIYLGATMYHVGNHTIAMCALLLLGLAIVVEFIRAFNFANKLIKVNKNKQKENQIKFHEDNFSIAWQINSIFMFKLPLAAYLIYMYISMSHPI